MEEVKSARLGEIALAVVLVALSSHAVAACRLPSFFGDHMVLQRSKPVPVWGWAAPGEAVVVTFAEQTVRTVADGDGRWLVKLHPLAASAEGRTLEVRAGNTLTLQDVVVGEVWLCSGQSNMWFQVSKTLGAKEAKAGADLPDIRVVEIPRRHAPKPELDVPGTWVVSAPKTVGNFTAVGFYFARELHGRLDVPVGIICSTWFGTRIEPWTPPIGFRGVPALAAEAKRIDGWNPATPAGQEVWGQYLDSVSAWVEVGREDLKAGRPLAALPAPPAPESGRAEATCLFNAMIRPLVPYALRGVLWYQGEANGEETPMLYRHRMRALVTGWRHWWADAALPFYYVQLPNYGKPNPDPAGGDGFAALREEQRRALELPHTGMAVTIDIGNARDVHPKNKRDVAARLLRWALHFTYSQSEVLPSGPLYRRHRVDGRTLRIEFDWVGEGLMAGRKQGEAPVAETPGVPLRGFSLAGADRRWHAAQAVIDGATVCVSADGVTAPIAVRYAYAGTPVGANLYNRAGLPASPFRTDSW